MLLRPSHRDPRGTAGQATVEYVAIVGLVGLLLTGGALAALGWAPAIANAVNSGIRRAICVAGGDDCADFHVQKPCVQARDDRTFSSGGRVLILRVGGSESLVIERNSDDTYRITTFRGNEGGVGLSIGARFGFGRSAEGDEELVRASGGAGSKPFDLSASVEARLRGGWGRTWNLPDGAAAKDFVRRYEAVDRGHRGDDDALRDLPRPDVDVIRVGADAKGTASAGVPDLDTTASGSVFAGLAGERLVDRRTGETTVSLALDVGAAASIASPVGLSLGADVAVEPSVAVTMDRNGRPREMRLNGRVGGAVNGAGRAKEFQVRVDLTRPEVGRELGRLVGAMRRGSPAGTVRAASALGRWAASDGWVDERTYRTADSRDGTELDLSLGVGFGYHDEETRSIDRLAAARTRPPGGVWETRRDCRVSS